MPSFSKGLFPPTPDERSDFPEPNLGGFERDPSFFQKLLQYLNTSSSNGEAHASLGFPLLDNDKTSLRLEAAIDKYRQAPLQSSAHLTFSRRF